MKERCEVTNDGRVTEHATTTDVPYKGKDEVLFTSYRWIRPVAISKKGVSTKTIVTFNSSL